MPDYQKMYYILCSASSKAIDQMPDMPANQPARQTLLAALSEAEDLYINDSNLLQFPKREKKKPPSDEGGDSPARAKGRERN